MTFLIYDKNNKPVIVNLDKVYSIQQTKHQNEIVLNVIDFDYTIETSNVDVVFKRIIERLNENKKSVIDIRNIQHNSESVYEFNPIYRLDDFEFIVGMSLSENDFKRMCKYLDDDDDFEDELNELVDKYVKKHFYGDEE